MQISSTVQMLINALFNTNGPISLDEIPPGRIIDIGGGREGVIARAGGGAATLVSYFHPMEKSWPWQAATG